MRTCLLLLAIPCAIACGARTNLRALDERSGGEGGDGAQGGFGAEGPGGFGPQGGFGGQGGEACEVLVLDGGPIGITGGGDAHQLQASLTRSDDEDTRVTVAVEWQSIEGPSFPSELRHVTLSPWDEFPKEAAPSYLADLDRGVSFAAGDAPGFDFSLLYGDGTDLYFSRDFVVNDGFVPDQPTLLSEIQPLALFAARSEERVLAGYSDGDDVVRSLSYRAFGPSDTTSAIAGCGIADNVALTADAAASNGGWLLAYGTSSEVPDCAQDAPLDIATTLVITRVTVANDALAFEDVAFIQTAEIQRVRVVPRADGSAWVVFATGGASFDDFDPPPRIDALLIGASGMITGPFTVADENNTIAPTTMIAAAMGERLLVGWNEPQFEQTPLLLRLFAEDGDLLADGSIVIFAGQAWSAVGSPNGDAALIGWTENGDVIDHVEMRLGRVVCRQLFKE